MTNIFLSYRRGGTRADTGRIYDRLSAHFGDASVFMDIDDIEPGENFIQRLEKTLAASDVMLVIIGTDWVEARSEDGTPRLGAEDDFVSMELRQALQRGINIIPVLVNGARMPIAQQLPADLATLTQHQALGISDQHFHEDVDVLIETIERRYQSPAKRSWRWRYSIITLLVLVLGGLMMFFIMGDKTHFLRSEPTTLGIDQAKAVLMEKGLFDTYWNTSAQGLENQLNAQVINGDLVIVDKSTDLMWQKGGSGQAMTFELAQDYINALNSRRFADQDDWRLPTFEEAMSLMEAEKYNAYHLDPVFETAAAPFVFTSDKTSEGNPWVVYYFDGIVRPESTGFNASVRAVRTIR